jgi:hypothetical protein
VGAMAARIASVVGAGDGARKRRKDCGDDEQSEGCGADHLGPFFRAEMPCGAFARGRPVGLVKQVLSTWNELGPSPPC